MDKTTDQELPLVTEPAEGTPPVATTSSQIQLAIRKLAAGTGPFAIDTERASGFKYYPRAYLIQIKREGAPITLIDPTHVSSLGALAQVLSEDLWVLHAADQDLPCLKELGLVPRRIFDTEVAAQLLGYKHFSLGALVEQIMGVRLAKEHSAANWSMRPLPTDWLNYAALDVEYLLPMRKILLEALIERGRWEWAQEEFATIRHARPKPQLAEPWRKLPGRGKLRSRRELAILRALWTVREEVARENDLAPGIIISNRNLIELVKMQPKTKRDMMRFRQMRDRRVAPYLTQFATALRQAWTLDEKFCPSVKEILDPGQPPKPRAWDGLRPAAAVKLKALSEAVNEKAAELDIPHEMLLRPRIRQSVIWNWDEKHDAVTELRQYGAREWQIQIIGETVDDILREPTQVKRKRARTKSLRNGDK